MSATKEDVILMSAKNLARLGFLSALLGGGAVLAAASPAAAPTLANDVSSSSVALVGTLELQPGSCASGETGSYFRMILPGKTANGPDSSYISNGNSTCGDQTYTLLSPGTDGGFAIGGYQPGPSPAFDSSGNSLAGQIIEPVAFFGIKFSVETSAVDAQTGQSVPVPSINVDGAGDLSGNLEAFSAAWNKQYFNQGSPKPGGASPGLTAGPTGTYNASTGAFTLDWTSQIVGGPFNSFTGQWHLTGTFTAKPGSTPTTATPTTPTTPTTAPKSTGTPATTPPRSSPATNSATANSIAPESSGASGSSPGAASPDSAVPGSSPAAGTVPPAAVTAGSLADTGLSIPPFIGVPPLAVGLVLFGVARRMSRRTREATP